MLCSESVRLNQTQTAYLRKMNMCKNHLWLFLLHEYCVLIILEYNIFEKFMNQNFSSILVKVIICGLNHHYMTTCNHNVF